MEAENLLTIFDCYWFEQEILKKQQNTSNSKANPVEKTQQHPNQSLPTVSTNSMEELVSIKSGSSNNSLSPSSDLCKQAPRTAAAEAEHRRDRRKPHRKKKLERRFSKSLSDLEFEELKGFMELGFVFSEEDKGSDFLTIILPGLQRLGAEEEEQKEEEGDLRRKSEHGVGNARPYLSEVWKASERNNRMRRRRENQPLRMSTEKLPSVGNKIDMKDYIKTWAHSVASSVR